MATRTVNDEEQRPAGAAEHQDTAEMSSEQADAVQSRRRLPSKTIYHIVREEGEEELGRRPMSLWWSGVSAGISISFSFLAIAILHAHLPDQPWRHLVESMGYPLGFLIVILARQQLFTENTLTVVLPFMSRPTWWTGWLIVRLWTLVLAANMLGAALFAANVSLLPMFSAEVEAAMRAVAETNMAVEPFRKFLLGIGSGWLIAALVWLLSAAEYSRFWLILVISYAIGLCSFSHIVASATEAFLLLIDGKITIFAWLFEFALPVLAGNMIGGTAMFALIAYAQVSREVKHRR